VGRPSVCRLSLGLAAMATAPSPTRRRRSGDLPIDAMPSPNLSGSVTISLPPSPEVRRFRGPLSSPSNTPLLLAAALAHSPLRIGHDPAHRSPSPKKQQQHRSGLLWGLVAATSLTLLLWMREVSAAPTMVRAVEVKQPTEAVVASLAPLSGGEEVTLTVDAAVEVDGDITLWRRSLRLRLLPGGSASEGAACLREAAGRSCVGELHDVSRLHIGARLSAGCCAGTSLAKTSTTKLQLQADHDHRMGSTPLAALSPGMIAWAGDSSTEFVICTGTDSHRQAAAHVSGPFAEVADAASWQALTDLRELPTTRSPRARAANEVDDHTTTRDEAQHLLFDPPPRMTLSLGHGSAP